MDLSADNAPLRDSVMQQRRDGIDNFIAESALLPSVFATDIGAPPLRLHLGTPLTFLPTLETALEQMHTMVSHLESLEGEGSVSKRKLAAGMEALRGAVSACVFSVEERAGAERTGEGGRGGERGGEERMRLERKGEGRLGDGKSGEGRGGEERGGEGRGGEVSRRWPLFYDDDMDDSEDDEGDDDDDNDDDDEEDGDDNGEVDGEELGGEEGDEGEAGDNSDGGEEVGGPFTSAALSGDRGSAANAAVAKGAHESSDADDQIAAWHAAVTHLSTLVKRIHKVMSRMQHKKAAQCHGLEVVTLVVSMLKSLLQMPLLFAVGWEDMETPAVVDIALRIFSYIASIAHACSDEQLSTELEPLKNMLQIPGTHKPTRRMHIADADGGPVNASAGGTPGSLKLLHRFSYARCIATGDFVLTHSSAGLARIPKSALVDSASTPGVSRHRRFCHEAGDLLHMPPYSNNVEEVAIAYSSSVVRSSCPPCSGYYTLATVIGLNGFNELGTVGVAGEACDVGAIFALLSDPISSTWYSLSASAGDSSTIFVQRWTITSAKEGGYEWMATPTEGTATVRIEGVPLLAEAVSTILACAAEPESSTISAALLPPCYVLNGRLYFLSLETSEGSAFDLRTIYDGKISETVPKEMMWYSFAIEPSCSFPLQPLTAPLLGSHLMKATWRQLERFLFTKVRDPVQAHHGSVFDMMLKASRAIVDGSSVVGSDLQASSPNLLHGRFSEQLHGTVTCDQCGCRPVRGPRFKCLELPDYDLCLDCYTDAKKTSAQRKSTKDTYGMAFTMICNSTALMLPRRRQEDGGNAVFMTSSALTNTLVLRLMLPSSLCVSEHPALELIVAAAEGSFLESIPLGLLCATAPGSATLRHDMVRMLTGIAFHMSLATDPMSSQIPLYKGLWERGNISLLPIYRDPYDVSDARVDPLAFEALRTVRTIDKVDGSCHRDCCDVQPLMPICALESVTVFGDTSSSRVAGRLPSGLCFFVDAHRGLWAKISSDHQPFYSQRIEEMLLPARQTGMDVARARRIAFDREESSEQSDGMPSDLDALFSLVRGLHPMAGEITAQDTSNGQVVSRSVDGRTAVTILPRLGSRDPDNRGILSADAMLQSLAARLRPSEILGGPLGSASRRGQLWLKLSPGQEDDICQAADFRESGAASGAAPPHYNAVVTCADRTECTEQIALKLSLLSEHLAIHPTEVLSRFFAAPPRTGLHCAANMRLKQSDIMGYASVFSEDVAHSTRRVVTSLLHRLHFGFDAHMPLDIFALSLLYAKGTITAATGAYSSLQCARLLVAAFACLSMCDVIPGPMLRLLDQPDVRALLGSWEMQEALRLITKHFFDGTIPPLSESMELSAFWGKHATVRSGCSDSKAEDPLDATPVDQLTDAVCGFLAELRNCPLWSPVGPANTETISAWLLDTLQDAAGVAEPPSVTHQFKAERLLGLFTLPANIVVGVLPVAGPHLFKEAMAWFLRADSPRSEAFLDEIESTLCQCKATFATCIGLGIAEGIWSADGACIMLGGVIATKQRPLLVSLLEDAILCCSAVSIDAPSCRRSDDVLLQRFGIHPRNTGAICAWLGNLGETRYCIAGQSFLQKLMAIASRPAQWLHSGTAASAVCVVSALATLSGQQQMLAEQASLVARQLSMEISQCVASMRVQRNLSREDSAFSTMVCTAVHVTSVHALLHPGDRNLCPDAARGHAVLQELKKGRGYATLPGSLGVFHDASLYFFLWAASHACGMDVELAPEAIWNQAVAFARRINQYVHAAEWLIKLLVFISGEEFESVSGNVQIVSERLLQLGREDSMALMCVQQLCGVVPGEIQEQGRRAIAWVIVCWAASLRKCRCSIHDGPCFPFCGCVPAADYDVESDPDTIILRQARAMLVRGVYARAQACILELQGTPSPEELHDAMQPSLVEYMGRSTSGTSSDARHLAYVAAKDLLAAAEIFSPRLPGGSMDATTEFAAHIAALLANVDRSSVLLPRYVRLLELVGLDQGLQFVDMCSSKREIFLSNTFVFSNVTRQVILKDSGATFIHQIVGEVQSSFQAPPFEHSVIRQGTVLYQRMLRFNQPVASKVFIFMRDLMEALRSPDPAGAANAALIRDVVGAVIVLLISFALHEHSKSACNSLATTIVHQASFLLDDIPDVFGATTAALLAALGDKCWNAELMPLHAISAYMATYLQRDETYDAPDNTNALHPLCVLKTLRLLDNVCPLDQRTVSALSTKLILRAGLMHIDSSKYSRSMLVGNAYRCDTAVPAIIVTYTVKSSPDGDTLKAAVENSLKQLANVRLVFRQLNHVVYKTVVVCGGAIECFELLLPTSGAVVCQWFAEPAPDDPASKDDHATAAKRPRQTDLGTTAGAEQPRKSRRISALEHGLHDSGIPAAVESTAETDESSVSSSYSLLMKHPVLQRNEACDVSAVQADLGVPSRFCKQTVTECMPDAAFLDLVSNALRAVDVSKYDKSTFISSLAAQLGRRSTSAPISTGATASLPVFGHTSSIAVSESTPDSWYTLFDVPTLHQALPIARTLACVGVSCKVVPTSPTTCLKHNVAQIVMDAYAVQASTWRNEYVSTLQQWLLGSKQAGVAAALALIPPMIDTCDVDTVALATGAALVLGGSDGVLNAGKLVWLPPAAVSASFRQWPKAPLLARVQHAFIGSPASSSRCIQRMVQTLEGGGHENAAAEIRAIARQSFLEISGEGRSSLVLNPTEEKDTRGAFLQHSGDSSASLPWVQLEIVDSPIWQGTCEVPACLCSPVLMGKYTDFLANFSYPANLLEAWVGVATRMAEGEQNDQGAALAAVTKAAVIACLNLISMKDPITPKLKGTVEVLQRLLENFRSTDTASTLATTIVHLEAECMKSGGRPGEAVQSSAMTTTPTNVDVGRLFHTIVFKAAFMNASSMWQSDSFLFAGFQNREDDPRRAEPHIIEQLGILAQPSNESTVVIDRAAIVSRSLGGGIALPGPSASTSSRQAKSLASNWDTLCSALNRFEAVGQGKQMPVVSLEASSQRRRHLTGRASDDILVIAEQPIPTDPSWYADTESSEAPCFYFEVSVEQAERSTRDPPAVGVGLWSENAISSPSGPFCFGAEWGPGCYTFSGVDGCKASWVTHGISHGSTDADDACDVVLAPGAPVDILDLTGSVTWRPGIINSVNFSSDPAAPSTVNVHFMGWESKWDETINLQRPPSDTTTRFFRLSAAGAPVPYELDPAPSMERLRLAPFRSKSPGNRVGPYGWMMREPFGVPFGRTGDTVGCWFDISTGDLLYAVNGVFQGCAFRELRGRFFPMASTTNSNARLHFRYGAMPVMRPDCPRPSAGIPNAICQHLNADAGRMAASMILIRSTLKRLVKKLVDAASTTTASQRPKACDCWKRRLIAVDLCDFFPGTTIAQAMLVLRITGESRELAASYLLEHQSQMSTRVNDLLQNLGANDATYSNEGLPRPCGGKSHAIVFDPLRFAASGFSAADGGMRFLEHTTAAFGVPIPAAPGVTAPLMLANPIDASTELAVSGPSCRGAAVLVYRGACTFVVKARNVQQAGGSVMILVSDSDEVGFIPDCGSEDASDITIPIVMVGASAGEELRRIADAAELDPSNGPPMFTLKAGLAPPEHDAVDPSKQNPSPVSSATDVPANWQDYAASTQCRDSLSDVDVRSLQVSSFVHSDAYTRVPYGNLDDGLGAVGPLTSRISSTTARPSLQGQPSLIRNPSLRTASPQLSRDQSNIDTFTVGRRFRGSMGMHPETDRWGEAAPASPLFGSSTPGLTGQGSNDAGASDAAASLEAAEQEWLSVVEGTLRSRRVPHSTIESIMELLRQGGENEMAMARTMLDDLSIALPPRPTSSPALIGGASTATVPAFSLGAGALTGGSLSEHYYGLHYTLDAFGSRARNGVRSELRAPYKSILVPRRLWSRTEGELFSPAAAELNSLEVGQAVMLRIAPRAIENLLQKIRSRDRDGTSKLSDFVRVGTRVSAQWSGPSGGWYDAVVTNIQQRDGSSPPTFCLSYDDGDQENDVPADRIRIHHKGGVTLLSNLIESRPISVGAGSQADASSWLFGSTYAKMSSRGESMLYYLPFATGMVTAVDAGTQTAAVTFTFGVAEWPLVVPIRWLGVLPDVPSIGIVNVPGYSSRVPMSKEVGDLVPLMRAYLSQLQQHLRAREIMQYSQHKGFLVEKSGLSILASQLFSTGVDFEECAYAADPSVLLRHLCAGLQPELSILLADNLCSDGIINALRRSPELFSWLEEAALEGLQRSLQMLPTLLLEDGTMSACLRSFITSGNAVVHADYRPSESKDKRDPSRARTADGVAFDSLPITYLVTSPREYDDDSYTGLLVSFLAVDRRAALPPCTSVLIHNRPPIMRSSGIFVEPDSVVERRRYFTSTPNDHHSALCVENGLMPNFFPGASRLWLTMEAMPKQVREAFQSGAPTSALTSFAVVVAVPASFNLLILLARVLAQAARNCGASNPVNSLAACSAVALSINSLVKFVMTQHLPPTLRSVAAGCISELAGAVEKAKGSAPRTTETLSLEQLAREASKHLGVELAATQGVNISHTSSSVFAGLRSSPTLSTLLECYSALVLLTVAPASPFAGRSIERVGVRVSRLVAFRLAAQFAARCRERPPEAAEFTSALVNALRCNFAPAWERSSQSAGVQEQGMVGASAPRESKDDSLDAVTKDAAIGRIVDMLRWSAHASHSFTVLVEDIHVSWARRARERGVPTDTSLAGWQAAIPTLSEGLELIDAAYKDASFIDSHKLLAGYSVDILQLRYAMLRHFTDALIDVLPADAIIFEDSAYELNMSAPTFSKADELRRCISIVRDMILFAFRSRIFWDCISRTVSAERANRPKITINRFAAISPASWEATLLGQATVQLRRLHPASLRQEVTSPHLCFEVKLIGERVAGEGGPYKEFITHAMSEAMSVSGPAEGLPLFTVSPNAASNYGEFRELRVPSATLVGPEDAPKMAMYHALGVLLGCAIRTGIRCPLLLPSMFWKIAVGDISVTDSENACDSMSTAYKKLASYHKVQPTFDIPTSIAPSLTHGLTAMQVDRSTSIFSAGITAGDLDELDHYLVANTLQPLRHSDGDDFADRARFEAVFGGAADAATLTFSTTLRDGKVVEMWPASAAVGVPYELRYVYADWVQQVHTESYVNAFWAMRAGLMKIVPPGALAFLTWRELERIVCGASDVDVDLLQRHTEYSSNTSPTADHVQFLWAALREMNPAQRTLFARFVFGQDRLPATDAEWESQNMRMLIKTSLRPGASPAAPPGRPSGLLGIMGAVVSIGSRGVPASTLTQGQVDKALPTADVCFANLSLPQYSSPAVLKERLLVAISMDSGLDADDVR